LLFIGSWAKEILKRQPGEMATNPSCPSGTFINNGVVLNAGWVIVTDYSRSGDDEIIQTPSATGFHYQLQVTPSLDTPAWTNVGASQSGTGGALTFTEPGGATNGPSRFYRVDVAAP
jgi:hypothetical protein